MRGSAIIYSLLAAIFLALRDIFGRQAMRQLDPLLGTAGSAVLGLPILVIVSLFLGDFHRPWPAPWPLFIIALAGILRITAYRTLLFAGIKQIGAARASPLGTTSTLFAMLLGIVFLGENLTLVPALGSALIIGGSYILARSQVRDTRTESTLKYLRGVALALSSSLALGASSVFARAAVDGFASPNHANFFANGAAVLSYAPLLRGKPILSELKAWSRHSWAMVTLSGSAASLGVTFSYFALAEAPVVFVAPLTQTRPLIVVAIAWVLFQAHERVSRRVTLGTLVIVLGAVLIMLGR